MGLLNRITAKTAEARAREKIRPLVESRMMRDILLEIGQRGCEQLDLQSVPMEQRARAERLAAECGTAGLKQSVVDELQLDAAGISLLVELKPTGDNAAVLTQAVLDLVEQSGVGARLMFMSQDLTSVNMLQSAHPEWWVGYCAYGSTGDLDEGIWQYNVDFLAVEESMISNRLARMARSQGLPLYVWSVYDSDKMLQYLQMGVVGLITDFPDIARGVVDDYRAHDNAPYRMTAPGQPPQAA